MLPLGKGVKINVHVLDNLINVGKLVRFHLLICICELSLNSSCSSPKTSKTCKVSPMLFLTWYVTLHLAMLGDDSNQTQKKFDLMHDLYGCLGDVLGKFSVACAVRQGSGRPLFELCGKNTTASTMASDLPSNQVWIYFLFKQEY